MSQEPTSNPQLPRWSRELTPATRALIEQFSVPRAWGARQSIFREGEQCEGLHIVASGLVKLCRGAGAGREQILLIVEPGNPLSVAPLLDGGAYPLSARAMHPTRTLFLPAAVFRELYASRRDFARAVISDLSLRNRLAISLLSTISLKPVLARVATLLLEAGALTALPAEGDLRLMLTQAEVAQQLATTREEVARSFAVLRRDGIIDQHGRVIRIRDSARLRKYSGS